MIICHVCKAECEETMELCPVCGAELKIEVQEEITEENDIIDNPTLLATFEDLISAEIFMDILKDNDIHFSSSSQMGEAIQVTFGGGLTSEDIYVSESDLERATQLLEEFSASEINFEDEFIDSEEEV